MVFSAASSNNYKSLFMPVFLIGNYFKHRNHLWNISDFGTEVLVEIETISKTEKVAKKFALNRLVEMPANCPEFRGLARATTHVGATMPSPKVANNSFMVKSRFLPKFAFYQFFSFFSHFFSLVTQLFSIASQLFSCFCKVSSV